jgi:hypothetical protein
MQHTPIFPALDFQQVQSISNLTRVSWDREHHKGSFNPNHGLESRGPPAARAHSQRSNRQLATLDQITLLRSLFWSFLPAIESAWSFPFQKLRFIRIAVSYCV